MKKIFLSLFLIASLSSMAQNQQAAVIDPLVGATAANKGDMLVAKKWIPTFHTVLNKQVKPNAKDFSMFLASGGYDATTNGTSAMGTWMYDSASNKLTIKWGEKTTEYDLKEINEKGFTIKNAREEVRFSVGK